MSIKTLSTANVNIGSKPDFPNGLTVSSGNVGIGTRTASYPLDVQTLGSGVTTAQRLVVNSSYFTFANGTVTVDNVAKTGTITITSAEAYTSSLIYTGMILTATGSGGNLGTMATGTYVTVTGTSVNGSSQLVIAYSYPGGTAPVAGTVTAVIVSGYVAGWGPSLLFTGGGASVDLASIAGLVGTSNSNTAGDLAFNTRSSGTLAERMRITSSGNVGIGTTSPEEALHVKGTSAWVQPIIDSSLSTTGGSSLVLRGNQNTWAISSRSSANGYANNGFSLYESLNNAIRMVVLPGGNVGIGTIAPAQMLHVAGRTLIGGAITNSIWDINADSMGINRNISSGAIYDATGHAYQWQHSKSTTAASNTLTLQVYTPAGASVAGGMTITGAGNVGIGTLGPSERFSILDGNFLISKTSYGGLLKWTQGTTSPRAGYWEWGDGTGWRMDFGPSATPRLSIFDNGNVGIGTTSPSGTLHVIGDSYLGATSSTVLLLRNVSGENRIDSYNYPVTANYPLLILGSYIRLATNDVERVRITNSGVGIGTASPSATLHVVGTVAGAVAPRIFIPASAFVPFTSTAPSLSQNNGVYILTFAALDSAYTYIIVPSNYNGTNDIKIGVYGAAGTANALVEYQKNSAPTTSMGTASVTVNSSLTPTLTAWTLLSAQTLPSPGHLMQIKISAPTGKTLTLYGVAISFGE